MRKSLNIGIGAGVAAITATMAVGVASAATSSPHAASSVAATASASKHVTRAQAGRIAQAKVPHSKVHEIESDDLHGRPVWKVQLTTPKGRVTVDVDKKTGRAIIVRRGGGHDNAVAATTMAGQRQNARDNDAADDRGQDARDNDAADDRGQDARDNDAADDRAEQRGDRHDRDRGDRHDHDRGDDGPGR